MFRLNLRRLFISAPKTIRRSTQSSDGFIVKSNCLYGLLPSTVNSIWRYNNFYKNYKSKFSKWLIFTSSIAFTLLSAQPNLDEKRLFRAAHYGTIQEIKRLCSKSGKVKPDVRHPLGWTPLMVAAANGHTDVVKALLDCGASVNLQDQYHNPQITGNKIGMHMLDVMLKREEEFCEALTAKASFLGFTALHYAALADSSDVVSVLLRHKADPLIRDHAGRRPLDYVREDSPLKNVLLQYTEQMEKIEKGKLAEERRRFPLEQRLRQYIVGQHSAINTVAAAIRRKENGWADDEHPLVFLFLGSSGIGKTELAKQLAHYIHKEHTQGFIRLDMSEYQEKHEVAKLIGAPPGYIGHDDGGQLTKHLAKQPDAVVLFDEVDKAHPDVLTVLLQLFDEGRITDGKGKLIECKNAIFVMTSNLASDEIANHGLQLREEAVHVNKTKMQDTFDTKDETLLLEVSRHFKDNVVRPILKRHFGRDEFLGRINEIVYFLPFSRQELITLVSMELTAWASKAIKRHSIELKWENGVLGTLADGYDIHYGARSIKHEVERRVINKIALAAERGILATDSSIMIAIDDKGKINIMMKKKNEKKYIPIG